MDKQVVIFELAEEHYGVDIASVESIIKLQPITSVPHAPSYVEGITNLRGKILPVIDLRQRFGLPSRQATSGSRIVVVILMNEEVGLVVDGVSEVLIIKEADIEPIHRMMITLESDFITSIARLEGRLVILLNLDAVLSDQQKSTIQVLPAAV